MSKYQRFVAGRYLFEQGSNLSSAILGVVAACLWVAAGMGAACLWYPFADITMVPPPNPPVWMVVVVGLSFTLPIVGFLSGLVVWAKGHSCRTQLWLALYWCVISLACFALFPKGMQEGGMTLSEIALAGLVMQATFVGPATWIVLLGWRQGRPASSPALAIALLGNPLAAVIWLFARRLVGARWARPALAYCLALGLVAVGIVVIRVAAAGVMDVVVPLLFPESDIPLGAFVVFGFLIAAAFVLIWMALNRSKETARSLGEGLALIFAVVGIIVATTMVFWHGVAQVSLNLEFVGGWKDYTPPMELIIPAMVAAALAILAGVLLFVRYSFSFFTTVSVGGVTIGTMALVIVLSVMSGFETDLREKILGFNAHIQISHNDELQFTGYEDIEKVLAETDGVIGYTPFLMTEAYMSNHNNYGNVTLKGIDPERVAGVTEIVHNLVEGDERALEKIWPLNDDGSIAGEPPPGDRGTDSDLNFDLDDVPEDFSGGAETAEDALEDAAPSDDEDMDLGEITDFSGGLDEYTELLDGGDEPETLGVDASAEDVANELDLRGPKRDFLRPEVAVLDGLLVGQELVNQISLYTGQEIRIISPLPDTSPDGLSIPRLQNFRIAGKFMTGMYEYDLKYVYCSLSALQSFLDLGDEVNGIEVRVKDPDQTDGIVRKLEASLGPEYRVQDWKELNKALFSALKLEKIAMFFILVIIVLVASFSIVGNLIMVVIEKAKEIAILKTLGSSNRGVMNIFITQGFFIGLVGTSLGLALGLGACYLGVTYGVPLDPDVYYIDKLPIQVEPWSVVSVGFAGVAISVVATIYPAYIAARMRPVKGLRWD